MASSVATTVFVKLDYFCHDFLATFPKLCELLCVEHVTNNHKSVTVKELSSALYVARTASFQICMASAAVGGCGSTRRRHASEGKRSTRKAANMGPHGPLNGRMRPHEAPRGLRPLQGSEGIPDGEGPLRPL